MVQVGSFGDAENARRLAQRVATFGFSVDVSEHRAGGRDMHRVRVGPEPSRQRAESVASSLAAHGFVAQVVPAGT
jgi:cell division septation protein DedD